MEATCVVCYCVGRQVDRTSWVFVLLGDKCFSPFHTSGPAAWSFLCRLLCPWSVNYLPDSLLTLRRAFPLWVRAVCCLARVPVAPPTLCVFPGTHTLPPPPHPNPGPSSPEPNGSLTLAERVVLLGPVSSFTIRYWYGARVWHGHTSRLAGDSQCRMEERVECRSEWGQRIGRGG